jgi:hypothetical protein
MSNNKQQTAVDVAELAMKLYPFSNSERNAFITGYNKAKEMEKERMIQFCIDWFISREMNIREYYEQTYGEDDSLKINNGGHQI